MSIFFVAVTSDLTRPLEFRSMVGRNFSAPITLSDGRNVRIFVVDAPKENQPLQINIVGEDGETLAQSYLLENTTQIFTKLGLLTNVAKIKTQPSEQEKVDL